LLFTPGPPHRAAGVTGGDAGHQADICHLVGRRMIAAPVEQRRFPGGVSDLP